MSRSPWRRHSADDLRIAVVPQPARGHRNSARQSFERMAASSQLNRLRLGLRRPDPWLGPQVGPEAMGRTCGWCGRALPRRLAPSRDRRMLVGGRQQRRGRVTSDKSGCPYPCTSSSSARVEARCHRSEPPDRLVEVGAGMTAIWSQAGIDLEIDVVGRITVPDDLVSSVANGDRRTIPGRCPGRAVRDPQAGFRCRVLRAEGRRRQRIHPRQVPRVLRHRSPVGS